MRVKVKMLPKSLAIIAYEPSMQMKHAQQPIITIPTVNDADHHDVTSS